MPPIVNTHYRLKTTSGLICNGYVLKSVHVPFTYKQYICLHLHSAGDLDN